MQWTLVDTLQRRHSELFSQTVTEEQWWATGLRTCMEAAHIGSSNVVADRLGARQDTVWDWMDLAQPVPSARHRDLCSILGVGSRALLSHKRPDKSKFLWAVGLAEQMEKRHLSVKDIANSLDAAPARVQAWRDQELHNEQGLVPPVAQTRLADILDIDTQALFAPSRARQE